MNILIASDSYKGSLSSIEVADCISKGILEIFPESTIKTLAMADGGEGTVDALIYSLNGKYQKVSCFDPLYENIEASYGLLKDNQAIMEMASASGLPLVKEKRIKEANTYGTGQMIKDALDHNCKTIYIGIGGSATNDGGIGMASALGIRFLDKDKNLLKPVPKNIPFIKYIDNSHLDPRIKETKIIVMCDVDNPLCGKQGASYIYGPQKGADQEDVVFLDNALKHLAQICEKEGYKNYQYEKGAGAAGGLGFGLMTFCNATLQSGIETVLDIVNFDNYVKDCDLVITGEGRIDNQSIYGKVPVGVAKAAAKYNIDTIAIVGSIGREVDQVYDYMTTIESCVDHICDLDEAINNASANVFEATKRVMKAIKLGMKL